MEVWTFDDFDEFAEAVGDADLQMFLRNLVESRWTLRHLDLGGIHIQMGIQGSGDIVEGQTRRDGYLLYLPLMNPEVQQGNGVALDPDAVAVFEPGCEFILSSHCDHQWCSVFVATDALTDAPLPAGGNASRLRVTHPPVAIVRRFRRLVLRILVAAESHEAVADSDALRSCTPELSALATQIICSDHGPMTARSGRPVIPRHEIFARVRQLMTSSHAAKLPVAQLADACGVTDRTMRTVFVDSVGLTPKQYLQYRTLNLVHRALRAADPEETSVSTVLLDHGEWDFGRFARRYRQAFGELPSQTLRRS